MSSHLYFGATGLCGVAPLSLNSVWLGFALAAQVGLESWINQRGRSSGLWGVAFLVAQFALIELTASVDCAGFSKFLYLIGPLWAYALFGRAASIGLGSAYFGVLLIHLAGQDPLWAANREYVTVLLIFAIGLIFAVLMADALARREAGRQRSETLLRALEQSHAELEASLARQRELAATEERNRLAREIHDGLGHHLTAITIQLGKARAFRGIDPTQADRAIEDAEHAARDALRDVRESVATLRDGQTAFSLRAAIERLVANGRHAPLEIFLHFEGTEDGFAQRTQLALYRAAQEALTNVQKHARASHVWIDIVFVPERATLIVRDDGVGFAATGDVRPEPDRHYGLSGLRERAALAGGTLAVASAVGSGTQLTLDIPRDPDVKRGAQAFTRESSP
ncbi:MAG TPA: sensor histidine kinase [Anaerolineales bacterium]|nr:sensor histidine kinase [Anaerolineales bacterium]